MTEAKQDIWSQWLLHRRFGGDPVMQEAIMKHLYSRRDKVLSHAALAAGEILLDVGCGDGLIAFGALDKVETSQVIFSDISQELLNHAQALAQQMNLLDRCRFLCAPAEDLSALDEASVDVVTTRSVLIYVSAKQQAFDEFYRVLKPKGRLSIFEPINRFTYPEPVHLFAGYDVTPVMDIADKIKAIYAGLQPMTDPMLDFDERDLITFGESAGFRELYLELQVEIHPMNQDVSWETCLRSAGNPKIPTLEEAMHQALTVAEANKFSQHLRPLVENKQGVHRLAVAFLWAIK